MLVNEVQLHMIGLIRKLSTFIECLKDIFLPLGLSESRLPVFSIEEQKEIAGSYDFFGLNAYTSRQVTAKEQPSTPPSYEFDRDTSEVCV